MKKCVVSFSKVSMPAVELSDGAALSEILTIQNSPILFGCRIGICGTCLIEVIDSKDPLLPRTPDENEFLEAIAPGNPQWRLACQIHINTDITIQPAEI